MSAPVDQLPWSRLDKRMLLIHPITEVVRLLPVVVLSLVVGSRSGNHLWGVAVVLLLVAAAMLRWFTTGYRIGTDDVQLRTGLIQKKVLSIPRGRIRSVDVQAGPLHRILGLSILTVGTEQLASSRSEKFELNALDSSLVPALREELLTRTEERFAAPQQAIDDEREIAHFQLGWARYAPFTATGIAVVGAGFGLVFQSGVAESVANSTVVDDAYRTLVDLGIAAVVAGTVIVLLIVASTISVARYLLVYGNLTVTDDGNRLRVGHGLLTTRHTTLDRERLRGALLRRPLVLRWARGARLDAVMTGVSASEGESSLLLPPAPLTATVRTMTDVLADFPAANAGTMPLRSHGPVALRRRLTRTVGPVVTAAIGVAIYASTGREVPFWVWILLAVATVAAVGLALDRYSALGHRALPGVVISEHGSLDRRRVVIDTDGVVAWGVRQSFFQRRAGVATVTAATAAGSGAYRILDIPVDQVWQMMETAQPGACDVWLHG
ncbi:MAG: PH domain-containing protein [Rhodococcus sp. (in: high G+C Gram-positive bacteria)]